MQPERRRPRAATGHRPAIAVALHDVTPASFGRCALIRDWLDDQGIGKVTLLVIPASDLHPFHDRRPDLAEWLAERVRSGDTVAQHGLQHRRSGRGPRGYGRGEPGEAAEFAGLDEAEAKRAVDAGLRVLRLAGIQPRGFVAPAYVYTAALQRVLAASFDWWASLHGLRTDHGRGAIRSPALALGATSPARLRASPALLRVGALRAGDLLRLDIHPDDLDVPRHVSAMESVLRRARHRQAVTYDELALTR